MAVWGWVLVAFFVSFIGLGMAEICSTFPTAGSLYFWTARLVSAGLLFTVDHQLRVLETALGVVGPKEKGKKACVYLCSELKRCKF